MLLYCTVDVNYFYDKKICFLLQNFKSFRFCIKILLNSIFDTESLDPLRSGSDKKRIYRFDIHILTDACATSPVLCLECVGSVVLDSGVVDDEGGGGPALVLVPQHREVLVGAELPVHGVEPLEGWGRLAAAADLPEGGPVHPHRLGASLALVDGRRHWTTKNKLKKFVKNFSFPILYFGVAFLCITLFVPGSQGGPAIRPGILLYVQYLARCRDSNPSCCDCGLLMSYTHLVSFKLLQ